MVSGLEQLARDLLVHYMVAIEQTPPEVYADAETEWEASHDIQSHLIRTHPELFNHRGIYRLLRPYIHTVAKRKLRLN